MDSFAFRAMDASRRNNVDIADTRRPLNKYFRKMNSDAGPTSLMEITHNLWKRGPVNQINEYYSNFFTKKFREAVDTMKDHLLEKDKPYALHELRKQSLQHSQASSDSGQIALADSAAERTRRMPIINENTPIHQRFAPVSLSQIKDDHMPTKIRRRSTRGTLTRLPTDEVDEELYVQTSEFNPCYQSNKTGIEYSKWVEYDNHTYVCNGTEVTKEEYGEAVSSTYGSNCTVYTTRIRGCFCPQDRYGLRCEKPVSITCQTFRQSPRDDCLKPSGFSDTTIVQGGVHLSSSGLNCVRYRTKDTASLRFNMECRSGVSSLESVDANRFSKTHVYTEVETGQNMSWTQLMSNFSYFVTKNPIGYGVYEFAMTEPASAPMYLTPINFFDFSDYRGRQEMWMDRPQYYTGEMPFFFRVPFSNIPGEFYAGNRLYVEVGFPTVRPVLYPILVPIYIDFPDMYYPVYDNSSELLAYILIPSILVLMSAACLFCCGFQLYRKYRHHKTLKVD